MATIYSLICWGGKNGKATTSINSGTDTLTINNHGLRDGTGLVPQSSVNGLTSGTPYYARSTGTNTFTLHTSAAGAIANTGLVDLTGTTNLTFKSKYYTDLTDKSRWTYSTVEYIFDSLSAWRTHRVTTIPALPANQEVCEIGMAWNDIQGSLLDMTMKPASMTITTMVNGSRSTAFHNGNMGSGYVFEYTGSNQGIQSSWYNQIYDGFEIYSTAHNGRGIYFPTGGVIARQLIIRGAGSTNTSGLGVLWQSTLGRLESCLIVGFYQGLFIYTNQFGGIIANNIIAKNNDYGVYVNGGATTNVAGFYYNNISIGNGTGKNWYTEPTTAIEGATNNAGLSTDTPWAVGTGTTISIATTDFAGYGTSALATTDNFRPALATSPQVDTAFEYYNYFAYDVSGSVRPSYEGGTTTYADVGCYEFYHGYGPWPTTQEVNVSGVVSGSRILIEKTDGTEIYNTDSPSWPQTTSYSTATDVNVVIRKGSAATYYQPITLTGTIDPEAGLTLSASGLQVEDIAASTYTAGVATDWTVNFSTGAIAHSSGTTRYSVQDLYSYHQNLTDDSGNMSADPLMRGVTPTMFELINTGSITDADLEDLYGGSVEFPDGDLWSNAYSVGSLSGTPNIYIYQGTTKLTQHWAAGHLDILIKAKNNGSLVESGLVDGFARKWGYTYDNYQVDLSGGGRNVMPIATLADASITATEVAVGGWTDVTVTFGTYSRDFGDGGGAQTYYCEIDCNNRPLSEVYQRLQYLCREGATGTLNGVAAETYQKAHASATAVKTAPFGTYSGGFMTVAPMVWLKNVPAGESYLYVVTDAAGGTHQNDPPANGLTINDLLAGSTVRVFETGTTTIISSTTNSGTSFVVADVTGNVDYTIQKDGYLIIRVVNQAVSGATVVSGRQTVDRAYQ